jgi:glucose/arabinose dehydrogenase
MGTTDTSFVTGVTVRSLTSDGTSLYMSAYDGTDLSQSPGQIIRKNLSSGVIDTLATGLRSPTAVRYDPQSGNLYFLEGGTPGAQYKNGTLKVIANIH